MVTAIASKATKAMRANIPTVVAAYDGESSRSRGAPVASSRLAFPASPVLPVSLVIVATIADARTSRALEIKPA